MYIIGNFLTINQLQGRVNNTQESYGRWPSLNPFLDFSLGLWNERYNTLHLVNETEKNEEMFKSDRPSQEVPCEISSGEGGLQVFIWGGRGV